MTVIGVISDTHGLMRPEALAALRGAQLILHAGDVGSALIMHGLAKLAPLRVVRGNNDRGPWARRLPERDIVEVGGLRIYLVHDIEELPEDLDGVAAVVYGHSHKPSSEIKDGVLYFNPGSAGPRRFRLPVSMGRLRVRHGALEPELIELAP